MQTNLELIEIIMLILHLGSVETCITLNVLHIHFVPKMYKVLKGTKDKF
jgi:hypothetical protein